MIDTALVVHAGLTILAALAAGAIGFVIGLGWERNEMIALQVDCMTLRGRIEVLQGTINDLRDEVYRFKQLSGFFDKPPANDKAA